VTKDDMEIVAAVHRALADRVGKDRFAAWFSRGVRMEPSAATLRIAAGDSFRLEYLRRAFRADLLAAAQLVIGTEAGLEFVVEAVATPPAEEIAAAPSAPPENATEDCVAEESTKPGPRVIRLTPAAIAPARDEQRTHRLPRRQFASLHDFHASDDNRVALSAAQTAAARPGTYSPLTFVGPPGSGKSHLLEGIWRVVRDSRSLNRVIYLSAEQFTNQFLEALRQSGTPSFRRKYRDVELLLIDDVQFFAGKQSTLVELVHTVDTLLREGRQLVFAADRPPSEMRGMGSELPARLGGGLVCTLQPADFATRRGILQQLAAKPGPTAPPEVLSWLAAQLNGDARQLAGAMHRLRAASEAHDRTIDLIFAQSVLDDLIHASRRPVRLPEIVEAVSDVFGVPADELQSSSKAASVTLPRMLIMFLARKWTRAAHSEISRTLGRKSHSTVVSAQHKVTEWLADGKTVSLLTGQCRVEDAIKRVESQLKLG
jgi:chromosomal replication initiator protein